MVDQHVRSALLPAQVDQLADMLSSVFLVHSGSNLQAFPTLNVTDVILATELSIHTFFQQVNCAQTLFGSSLVARGKSGSHVGTWCPRHTA